MSAATRNFVFNTGGTTNSGNKSFIINSNNTLALSNDTTVVGPATFSNTVKVLQNSYLESNVYAMTKVGIATSNPIVSLEVNTTDAVLLPKGTTGQRPGAGVLGYVRYNTSTSQFEGFGAGNTWGSLGGVKSTDLTTYVSAEMYPTSNDGNLRFVNSNVENMRITTNGNVGIALSNPSERLQVTGNAKVDSNVYVMKSLGVGTSNPMENVDIIGNTRVTGTFMTVGACVIRKATGDVNTSNIFNFYGVNGLSNDGSNVYITACNSVVIGTSTCNNIATFCNGRMGIMNSNPGYTVDVSGDINFTGALYQNNVLFSSGGGGGGSVSSQWTTGGGGVVYIMNSNVGIGINAPLHALDVVGNIRMSSNIIAGTTDSSNSPAFTWSNDLKTGMYRRGTGQIGFSTQGSNVMSLSNGVVSISSNLVVMGQLTVSNLTYITSNVTIYASENVQNNLTVTGITTLASNLTFSNYGTVTMYTSNNFLGVGKSNPAYALDVVGDIYASGDLIGFSDSNMKTDLVRIDKAVARLKELTGYTFARRDLEDTKRYAGLLAQDVQKVLPEVVYRDDKTDMLSIAYGNMAGLFVECIKELQEQIDDIKMRLL